MLRNHMKGPAGSAKVAPNNSNGSFNSAYRDMRRRRREISLSAFSADKSWNTSMALDFGMSALSSWGTVGRLYNVQVAARSKRLSGQSF